MKGLAPGGEVIWWLLYQWFRGSKTERWGTSKEIASNSQNSGLDKTNGVIEMEKNK